MSMCEKCWEDANGIAKEYLKLLVKRRDNPCTPEQQAGEFASTCRVCGRRTIHQITEECMAGCKSLGHEVVE